VREGRRQEGVILIVVLVFALLLTGTVATFLRKATIDSMIVRNREASARAEALARGGIEIAKAVLLEEKFRSGGGAAAEGEPEQEAEELAEETPEPVWRQISGQDLSLDEGADLRLDIRDAGARLNVNALFQFDEAGAANPSADPLIQALLEKVIDEMDVPPEEKVYDIAELAANLIDYVDQDDVRLRGGYEDDFYQEQDPPYRAANRPLRSLDELRRVEGFDAALVDALRPYLTVYPFAASGGINPNTAPRHVLALLFANDGVELRLAPEDTVREILKIREEGGRICGEEQSGPDCTPIRQIVNLQNAIYPPPSFQSDVFTVVAEARVGEVRRTIEAVIDTRDGSQPLLLSWRVL
jgi:general secretion pathway protein K